LLGGLLVASFASAAESSLPFGGSGLVTHWPTESTWAQLPDLAGVARIASPFGDARPALAVLGPSTLGGSDNRFPQAAQPGSISLWFNRPEESTNKVLFSCGTPRRGAARGLWIVGPAELCFYFFGHPQDLHVRIPGGIAADRWHHVVATYDGTRARLYYDGQLQGQVEVRLETTLRGRFQVGANLSSDDGRDFRGLLADVAVFSRALSGEEISTYYAEHARQLARLSPEQLRAYYAERRQRETADHQRLQHMAEAVGLEEVVFAVRAVDPDGHWYANFGYDTVQAHERPYYHEGGYLCRLNLKTGQVATLVADAKGGVRDPQLHYEGRKILFSYRRGGEPYYHLYEIDVDGSHLRQLTDGPYDDFEPTYLPDGGLVFCSSRCQRWVPCYRSQVAVLYRANADGSDPRPLSSNVEQENTPWPLPDGRILYQRWEYVDRSQIGYHHLWTMNPDGTGQMVFFGNQHPDTVMIDAKPIPGTREVVASFSPGHGRREHAGVITVVDPKRGPDDRQMARPLTTDGPQYRDPYPLSADCFLVARDTEILLLDGQGHRAAVYDLPAEWQRLQLKVHEPRPVQARPRERVFPAEAKAASRPGTAYLQDVYTGRNMAGVRRGEIKRLLVLEILPKPCNMFSGMEPLSYGGTFLLERVLGTVPVETDGSAHFQLPAMRSLFLVALDEHDMAVKRMQSFLNVQPGEQVSCVGCHEHRVRAPATDNLSLALRRRPSTIQALAGVPEVFDFVRDIQPILDRHCVACHDYERTARGGPMAGGVLLCGDRGPMFSHSYYALTIGAQFADGRNLRKSNYAPRQIGSSASPLLTKLDGRHYGVRLSAHEQSLVRLWIDSGAVYAGTYAALGTGSIGDYSSGLDRRDLQWPSVADARRALERRCAGCHRGRNALPDSPSDDKRMTPWNEGPMNLLASGESQRRTPDFRFNRHLLYNLSRPEKSLLLLAPLAATAGGYGTCRTGWADADRPAAVFADRQDADYQRLLRSLADARQHLLRIKRFDMPGFRPRPEYVREMKRFGLLPAAFDPAGSEMLDVYALERRYWRSFWVDGGE
jgi:hypothetical protein